MIEQDTIRLLRECDAGIRMGISSIEDILPRVENGAFREKMSRCKAEHEKLEREVRRELDRYQDEGKAPARWHRACLRRRQASCSPWMRPTKPQQA